MKPKNFPARKLMRQLGAKVGIPVSFINADSQSIISARSIRTKKRRSN